MRPSGEPVGEAKAREHVGGELLSRGPVRVGVNEDHRAHVTAWWSEVLGGPARYTEELRGYEGMLAHHRGLAITPEQRFRFASLLSLAADAADLPEDPEFRPALVAYVEWGTWLATHNSQPGAKSSSTPACRAGAGAEAPPFQP
jgi:hemoglobin